MFDANVAVSAADSKRRGMALTAGLLIAGSCFVLLFVAMAHLVPLFLRFTDSPYAKLPVVSTFFISVGGLRLYLTGRAQRGRVRGDGEPRSRSTVDKSRLYPLTGFVRVRNCPREKPSTIPSRLRKNSVLRRPWQGHEFIRAAKSFILTCALAPEVSFSCRRLIFPQPVRVCQIEQW